MSTRQKRTALFLVVLMVVATIPLAGGAWAPSDANGTAAATNGTNETATNEPVPNATEDWPQDRADAGRTGATDDSGPDPYPTKAWSERYEMLEHSDGFLQGGPTAPPTVANGTVYIPRWTDYYGVGGESEIGDMGKHGTIVARNVTTGEVLWSATGREQTQKHGIGYPTGSVAVANGTAYVSSEDVLAVRQGIDPDQLDKNGGLFALNAETGDIRWKRNETWSWGPPVVDDGTVYAVERANPSNVPLDGENNLTGIVDRDTRLHALDPETGETRWTEENATFLVGAAGGTVYVVNSTRRADAPNENDLIALDAETGEVRWRVEQAIQSRDDLPYSQLSAEERSEAVAVTPERVYVAQYPNRTVAYNATDGSQAWSTTLSFDAEWSDPVTVSEPAVADGRVYLTTRGVFSPDPAENERVSAVHALNATTGEREWRFETAAELETAPSVGDGTVYVGGQMGGAETAEDPDAGGTVAYALNASDGTKQWGFGGGVVLESLPLAVADGMLVSAEEGAVMITGGSITVIASTDEPPGGSSVVNDTPRRPNLRPTVTIETDPSNAIEEGVPGNTNVTLFANASDPDGEIASVEWEVDGDADDFTATGDSLSVRVPACGVVKITVRVTDDDGDAVSETVDVTGGYVFDSG